MIKLVDSLLISNLVLTLLLNDEELNVIDAYVETFDNCREQGYKLIVSKLTDIEVIYKTICWSRNRNSDDIVIYYSDKYEGMSYSENFWNSRMFFAYNQITESANYIKELLLNEKA